MDKTTVWDVYMKTLEMRSKAIKNSLKVPIKAVARELSIEEDIAEECAMVLEQLSLLHFDHDSKEITIADE